MKKPGWLRGLSQKFYAYTHQKYVVIDEEYNIMLSDVMSDLITSSEYFKIISTFSWMKRSFKEVFSSIGDALDYLDAEGTMTPEEIFYATSTPWNGEESNDSTAMNITEINGATNIPSDWDGSTSPDRRALSRSEIEGVLVL